MKTVHGGTVKEMVRCQDPDSRFVRWDGEQKFPAEREFAIACGEPPVTDSCELIACI